MNFGEIENLNRLIRNNEIETVIYKLPKNKRPGPDSFIGDFYQTFEKKLVSLLSNYSKQKQKTIEECFQTPLQGCNHLYAKPEKTPHTPNIYRAIFLMYIDAKNPLQNIRKLNSEVHGKDHTPQPSEIYSKVARMVRYPQINQCDTPH